MENMKWTSSEKMLYKAIVQGNLELAKKACRSGFLRKPAQVNFITTDGGLPLTNVTFLSRAISEGDVDLVRFLLEQGANPALDATGGVFSTTSSLIHSFKNAAPIALVLMEFGVDYNVEPYSCIYWQEKMPIFVGALKKGKSDLAEVLWDNMSLDEDVKAEALRVGLCYEPKEASIRKFFMSKGFSLKERPASLLQSICLAVANAEDHPHEKIEILDDLEAMQLRVRYARPSKKEQGVGSNIVSESILIDEINSPKSGAIVLEKWIELGADVNEIRIRGDKKNTPLLAAMNLNPVKKRHKLVNCLLKHGANVSEPNAKGQTPLMLAVDKRDPVMVRALISAGADLLQEDTVFKTAFSMAMEVRKEDDRVALFDAFNGTAQNHKELEQGAEAKVEVLNRGSNELKAKKEKTRASARVGPATAVSLEPQLPCNSIFAQHMQALVRDAALQMMKNIKPIEDHEAGSGENCRETELLQPTIDVEQFDSIRPVRMFRTPSLRS